jgi:hypothetical protein
VSLVLSAASLVGAATAAASTRPHSVVVACSLDYNTTQICPVAFSATAGKSQTFTVAKYEDLSNCNFVPPSADPGLNGRYTVAKVSINWGDGSAVTRGVAHLGTTCAGSSVAGETGQTEKVTGVHRFRHAGTFHLRVTVIYLRGAGDTYSNCGTAVGGTVYNRLSNCIALKAPAKSVVVVRS